MRHGMLTSVLSVVIITVVTICDPCAAACDELAATPRRFSEHELREIYRVGKEIATRVTENDVVIFLGRSPLWFAQAFRHQAPKIRTIDVAFSGHPYADRWSNPKEPQIAAFREYLTTLGLDLNVLIKTRGQRLVIVDHAQTGNTVSGFIELLNFWMSQLVSDHHALVKRHLFINLKNGGISPIKKYLVEQDVIDLAQDVIVPFVNAPDDESLGVYFPYWQWGITDPLRHTPSPTALAMQKQLADWLAAQP